MNDPEFAQVLEGCDAVISAFNAGWDNPNLHDDFLKGYDSILKASKKAQVPYLLVVGGAESLYVKPGLQLIDTPEFPESVYDGADAARKLLDNLKERKDVNWAFVSPPAVFTVKPVRYERTGKYRLGKDEVQVDKNGEPADITAPDLAVALVDDVEKKAHLFERFTVAEID